MRTSSLLRTGIPAAVLIFLYAFSKRYHEGVTSNLPEMPSFDLPWASYRPTPRDLTAGHWEQHTPATDEVELWGESNCRVDWSDGKDRHDIPKETKARANAVNNWKWVVDDGLPLSEWSTTAFIERMLQNRFGMMIIGDSLSNQMMVSLHTMLSPPNEAGPAITKTTRAYDVYMDKRYANFTEVWLNKHHPLFAQLQRKHPEIPRERFEQPIAVGIRTDIVVTDAELDQIMHEIGNQTPVQKFFRSQGDWRDVLNKYANQPGWEGELPGIVITNCGAHWNPHYMAPTKPEDLVASYDKLLDFISDTMAHFAERMPLRVLHRSIAPGHQDCGKFKDPVDPSHPITVPPVTHHGWQLFPQYNEVAKTKYTSTFEGRTTGRPAYWDIWKMSAVRPDAHVGFTGKSWDCLHVLVQSVDT
ncbi:hypothetical protein FRB99_005179 [Tulasnella sp. 403]|nr:hypothetical protein FRB99_005179 [Tulasnella sp. 403]